MSAETVASPSVRRAGLSELARVGPAVAVRYAAVGALAIALAALHLKHRPTSLCLLRTVTGVPCPMCGGTTAAVALGHGNLRDALLASPLAVGLLTLGPLLSAFTPPAWWHVARRRWMVLGILLLGSELWELHRFGFLS